MAPNDRLDAGRYVRIANEFADVRVRVVETRKGERLEIKSPKLDRSITLDAVALESLTWQDPAFFSGLLEEPYGPDAE